MKRELRKEHYKLYIKVMLSIMFVWILFTNQINPNEIIRITRPLMRNLEYRMVSLQVRGYNQLETENFIINYQDIDKKVLNLVAVTAESKYQQTVELFKYKPNNKIKIVLYDDPEPMMRVTTLRKGTPPMGVYYGDTLHILDPTHWIKDTSQMEYIFYREGPILHELVHLFTDHLARGNFPIWFTEGVSLYFEYEIDEYQWGKDVEFKEGEYTLDELTYSFNEKDQYLAYTKSFRIIKNYVEEHGLESLMKLIMELGEGNQFKNYHGLFKDY